MAGGYGKKAQDWTYITPRRAVYTQDEVITDPAEIPEAAVIDTTVNSYGGSTERGRHQTLVIYAIPYEGSLDKDAILYLWIDALWDTPADASPDTDSSSSPALSGSSSSTSANMNVPNKSQISASQRWALIEAAKVDNNQTAGESLAFSFPWLPAGRYKAAIGDSSSFGKVVIVEQHTE